MVRIQLFDLKFRYLKAVLLQNKQNESKILLRNNYADTWVDVISIFGGGDRESILSKTERAEHTIKKKHQML